MHSDFLFFSSKLDSKAVGNIAKILDIEFLQQVFLEFYYLLQVFRDDKNVIDAHKD